MAEGIVAMTDETEAKVFREELLRMAAEIVSAYVSRNPVAGDQLAEVIKTVHASLSGLQEGVAKAGAAANKVTDTGARSGASKARVIE